MAEIVAELSKFDFFIATFVGFSVLYFSFSCLAHVALVRSQKFPFYQKKSFRSGQIQTEIKRSMLSILMFSILSLFLHEGLKREIVKIDFGFEMGRFLLETLGLFLWNEVHFYAIHRAYHFKALYKYHADHHYSHVPSPFSAYSFHWSEGLLLGSVMPVIMLFHDFQFSSLMMLPVMSLALNVLGHSNIDFAPNRPMKSLLSFSKRHSEHHKNPHSNYSFFLPFLDWIFRTSKYDAE